MPKSLIKKTIKRSLVKTRDYIRTMDGPAPRPSLEERDYERHDTVYPWLNALLANLTNKDRNIYRPSYTWGLLHSAHLARVLGLKRFSAIEFGVAGGNGLVSLDRISAEVQRIFGVTVDVYGFDTGAGLPKPEDYRDLPNLYKEAAFPMDPEKLRSRLDKARLILGLVGDTIDSFIGSNPSPVGFISFDMDYYSSTMEAFRLLKGKENVLLPRIHCYFDDIMGFTHSEFTGERLAITEFNETHKLRKISPIYGLRNYVPVEAAEGEWPEKFYLAHIFDHSKYGIYDQLWRRPIGSTTDLRD